MKIKEITNYLESLAPLTSQANFDNCGLLVGDSQMEITSAISCLDCTEAIVEEAIQKGSNFIISHHPLIFKGLKKINGKNYIERTLVKAIKNEIAIYAIHTNLDHYRFGVNYEIGKRLGLENLQVLDPMESVLCKLIIYVPVSHTEILKARLFEAGAGAIGDYSECSFETQGRGTFKPNENASPFEGKPNIQSLVDEQKVEILVSTHNLSKVIETMKEVHPYEEVAYDIVSIQNKNHFEGSGMFGMLKTPISEIDLLRKIKEDFKCGIIRHTKLLNKPIQKIAFCGGSGSFLLNKAKQVNADIFITGDYKYHDFFDAENQIVIADIGHFESEQFTINLIADKLTKKFPTFVVHLTEVNTNPINYF
ncbi:MAG: Nif3-like dinuclear metal center hexameric protein [Flavobacteriia bacterium]|nr:Nif3-like dinuclear metal center hexameric protein [Flavobacteriia bacterium]